MAKPTKDATIEVFIVRYADDNIRSFLVGEPQSVGMYSQKELDSDQEKIDNGKGMYSYTYH